VKEKERGYIISVDPASNKCGISLWKDGVLVDTILLESNSPRDLFSIRLQTITLQLEMFLRGAIPEGKKVSTVVCEGVRSVLVQICIGALLTPPQIEAKITSGESFVHATSWKKWAQNRGATGPLKDIKGVKALADIGIYPAITSDDVADSILVYLCWRDRP
jgi:hypothetical protein